MNHAGSDGVLALSALPCSSHADAKSASSGVGSPARSSPHALGFFFGAPKFGIMLITKPEVSEAP